MFIFKRDTEQDLHFLEEGGLCERCVRRMRGEIGKLKNGNSFLGPPEYIFHRTFRKCAAAAAKSLQSCPILCNPMDCSRPGSSVHGIFQARVLEWGAIAFSKEMCRVIHFFSVRQSYTFINIVYVSSESITERCLR